MPPISSLVSKNDPGSNPAGARLTDQRPFAQRCSTQARGIRMTGPGGSSGHPCGRCESHRVQESAALTSRRQRDERTNPRRAEVPVWCAHRANLVTVAHALFTRRSPAPNVQESRAGLGYSDGALVGIMGGFVRSPRQSIVHSQSWRYLRVVACAPVQRSPLSTRALRAPGALSFGGRRGAMSTEQQLDVAVEAALERAL